MSKEFVNYNFHKLHDAITHGDRDKSGGHDSYVGKNKCKKKKTIEFKIQFRVHFS